MGNVIQLRGGERIRPEEFPPRHMETLNRNIDAIRDERYPVSEFVERVLSHWAVAVTLSIVGAFLLGLAAFQTGVR